MLVLTRKLEETILIGDDVEIRVLGISGGKVRLGLNAPKSVSIWRGEAAPDDRSETDVAASAEPTTDRTSYVEAGRFRLVLNLEHGLAIVEILEDQEERFVAYCTTFERWQAFATVIERGGTEAQGIRAVFATEVPA